MRKHYDIGRIMMDVERGLAEAKALAEAQSKTEDQRRFDRVQEHFTPLRMEGLRASLICVNEEARREMILGALADAVAGMLVNYNAMHSGGLVDDFELFVTALSACTSSLAKTEPGEEGCVGFDLHPQTVGHA